MQDRNGLPKVGRQISLKTDQFLNQSSALLYQARLLIPQQVDQLVELVHLFVHLQQQMNSLRHLRQGIPSVAGKID